MKWVDEGMKLTKEEQEKLSDLIAQKFMVALGYQVEDEEELENMWDALVGESLER